jgi:hypothetical protein
LYLGGLVLVVVVDLVIPEQSLVAVAPEEVLCADVLIGIFNTLFQRRHVFPVLPMLIPQVVGVDAAEDQGGDDDAVGYKVSFPWPSGRLRRREDY